MNEKHVELLAEALAAMSCVHSYGRGSCPDPVHYHRHDAAALLDSEPFRRLLDGVREEERATPGPSDVPIEGPVPTSAQNVWNDAAEEDAGGIDAALLARAMWMDETGSNAAAYDRHVPPGSANRAEKEARAASILAILDRALGGRDEQP